jgi:hypothetical protein
MHLSLSPFVRHAPPISFFVIGSPEQLHWTTHFYRRYASEVIVAIYY